MRIQPIALTATFAACALASFAGDNAPRRLTERELAVASALLLQEARHPEKPRPILVLTPTDPWLPEDTKEERPPDFPEDQWEQRPKPPSRELRDANHAAYDLTGVRLPPGATLFPREEFERAYKSEKSFKKLVKRLGGVEPLVLGVSRPGFEGDHRATILLHVLSTWSGCGGIDLYIVDDYAGEPAVELSRVLVIW